MAKQLLIDLDEYQQDLVQAEGRGKAIIMAAVRDIMDTGGKNVQLSEKASAELQKFIYDLKVALNVDTETSDNA